MTFFKLRLSLFFLFSLLSTILCAQDIDRLVHSTAGKSISNTDFILSYTVGETIVFTGAGSDVIGTQGFEQPDSPVVTIVDKLDNPMDLSVFPNPTHSVLFVNIKATSPVPDLVIEVTDVLGRKININYQPLFSISEQKFIIDFPTGSSGVYFLKISSRLNQFSNTQKIIKE